MIISARYDDFIIVNAPDSFFEDSQQS